MRVAIRDESMTGHVERRWTVEDVPTTLTLRELIRLRVREEVERFNAAPSDRFQGLVRPLDAEADLNGYRLHPPARIDWEEQAAAAIEAFGHNGFFVLTDGGQVLDLDEELRADQLGEVAFVRLVPIVGG